MQNLNDLSVAQLTAMYNERVGADAQIKKFSTKADGVRRVGALLEAEKQAAAVAEKPAKAAKEPKAAKPESRISKMITALRDGALTVEQMADKYNTTVRVIRNDLCDIRKQLDGASLVRDTKAQTYTIKDAE